MLRRLPILIVPILLCTSCNTFFTKLVEPDAGDSIDMTGSDTDPGDMSSRPDADRPDMSGDMQTADVGDVSDDMADMPDMSGPYVWDGVSTDPLAWRFETCTAPAANRHPQLALADRPTGPLLTPKISFVPLYGMDEVNAQLAWVDDGLPRRAEIGYQTALTMMENDVFLINRTVMMDNPSTGNLPVTEAMVGQDDASDAFIYGTTTGTCSADPILLLGNETNPAVPVGCPAEASLETLEAAGGYNPFNGTVASGRAAVWQESVSQNVVVAARDVSFGAGSAISGAWPATNRASDNFLLTNRGSVIFLPDSTGTLWSWSTGQEADGTEQPPVQTNISGVSRGSAATAYLSGGRYVIARRVRDAIELLVYQQSTTFPSQVGEIGLWYVVTGLENPDGVELATFDGGFALWYQERDRTTGSEPNQWTVRVFGAASNDLTVYDCPYSYEYAALDYLDNDLAAWRLGTNVLVAGAVHYRLDGAANSYINIEGPLFEELF